MKISFFAALFLIFLSGCSHTINFRASHFAVPITGDEQWNGHVALAGTSVTKVTLVDNVYTNPPQHNPVRINSDIDAGDVTGVNYLGLDASLTLLKRLDFYIDSSLLGLRFQFLNHGAGNNKWVASVQGAMANRDESSSVSAGSGTADSSTQIKTTQLGASIGYKLDHIVPYVSYIRESHETSTDVKNNNGSFGPFKDSGVHQYYSIGVASHGSGFRFALEYNRILIDWEDALDTEWQDAMGVKLGLAW